MIELKHTKGPWVKDYQGTIGHIKSIGDNGYCDDKNEIKKTPTVCKYQTEKIIIPKEQVEANARLIVCAPEMLEMALAEVKTKFYFFYKDVELCRQDAFKKLREHCEWVGIIEKATSYSIEDLV